MECRRNAAGSLFPTGESVPCDWAISMTSGPVAKLSPTSARISQVFANDYLARTRSYRADAGLHRRTSLVMSDGRSLTRTSGVRKISRASARPIANRPQDIILPHSVFKHLDQGHECPLRDERIILRTHTAERTASSAAAACLEIRRTSAAIPGSGWDW